jgi:hypothetical protein
MAKFERYDARDDAFFDGGEIEDEDQEGSRVPFLVIIGLFVVAAFAGVVYLAYTQGVQRGRADAPRMLVAASGPVKEAPAAPSNTQTPYTGLKIYEQPAPAEDEDVESAPQPPTPKAAEPGKTAAPAPLRAKAVATAHAPSTPKVVATAPPAMPKAVASALAPKKVKEAAAATAPAAEPNATPNLETLPAAPVATNPPHTLHAPSSAASVPALKPSTAALASNADQAAKPAPVETPPGSGAQPAVVIAPAPVLAPAGGANVALQIGAYKSEEEANAAWTAFSHRHPMATAYQTDIQKADLGSKGVWYRLRLGSFVDKTEAAAFCSKLKADGGTCFLAK